MRQSSSEPGAEAPSADEYTKNPETGLPEITDAVLKRYNEIAERYGVSDEYFAESQGGQVIGVEWEKAADSLVRVPIFTLNGAKTNPGTFQLRGRSIRDDWGDVVGEALDTFMQNLVVQFYNEQERRKYESGLTVWTEKELPSVKVQLKEKITAVVSGASNLSEVDPQNSTIDYVQGERHGRKTVKFTLRGQNGDEIIAGEEEIVELSDKTHLYPQENDFQLALEKAAASLISTLEKLSAQRSTSAAIKNMTY